MNKETKTCQNCTQGFVIEPEDFTFYKKIDVPPPSWCPDCRMQRRMAHWNERVLYKRKCDLCDKNIVTIYSPDKPFKVYCNQCWWSDKWGGGEYGREYDFKKSFFEQFHGLQKEVPRINLLNKESINSEYCHDADWLKDCYLCFLCGEGENCAYCTWFMDGLRDSFDSYKMVGDELCYQDIDCWNSYRLFFSEHCHDCRDSYFLYDCRNLSNCFACVDLRNRQYHIFNQPYSKEEYFKKLEECNLGSYESLLRIKKQFDEFKMQFPRKFARILKSFDIIGNNIGNAKNCHYCFDVYKGAENCKYIYIAGWGLKDAYDCYDIGYNVGLSYESLDVVISAYKVFFSSVIWESHDVLYSDNCHNSHNLFGCSGLRDKSYCIFNKQYTKEEYEELVPKIVQHMNDMPYTDKKGRIYRFGEFFPIELSPFGYNETVAQQRFALTKEEIEKQGYNYSEIEKYQGRYKLTIKASDLPDQIKDADEKILNEIIECSSCKKAYRLIKPEFEFLKKQNLSLPRKCPECRHKERIAHLEPIKLWRRKCMCAGEKSENGVYKNTIPHNHGKDHCPNEFETTYSSDRPEIIYCEKCYQAEVV